jgi:AraC-like DNA-binding protein
LHINYIDTDNGVAGFSQKNYRLKRHAHFPIEVVFTLSGDLNIGTDTHQYKNIQSAVIDSNVPHTFNCLNGECLLYFIDPSSYAGKNISKYYLNGGQDLIAVNIVEVEHFKKKYIENRHPGTNNMDSRVQSCLDWIKKNYATEGINIAMICQIVYLSESRLAHLFKKQVGISVHQYILWKKVEMAVKHAMEGSPLTECAYSSGFADSSHFIKTFQKMFGIYPSFAVKK